MFDFQKLNVYQKARIFNQEITPIIKKVVERERKSQFIRAATSIQLNIAEGSGRFTKRDKRNFYVISRGSVFECVAILDILNDQKTINFQEYSDNYDRLEEISKMLYSMIRNLE